MSEVVFWTDDKARITFVNEAWTRQTGIRVADAIGLSVLDFVHPDDRPRAAELARDLLAGRIGDFTLRAGT